MLKGINMGQDWHFDEFELHDDELGVGTETDSV